MGWGYCYPYSLGTIVGGTVTTVGAVGTAVCIVAIPISVGLSIIPGAIFFGMGYGGAVATTFCGSKTGHKVCHAAGIKCRCNAKNAAKKVACFGK